jgi:O-antigen/teichoic acid export membrane protein
MIKTTVLLLRKHISLSVMGLGALSVFIANLGFKSLMNVEEYYHYSITITVLSLLASFGALGIEQVFLRLSLIKQIKFLVLDVKLISAAIVASIITTLLASSYLYYVVELNVGFVSLTLLCSGVIYLMLLYNIFRTGSEFIISQLINNSWKILLGVLAVIIFSLKKTFDYVSVLTICIWLVIIISLLLIVISNRVRLSNSLGYKEILLQGFNFFIALLTLSFLAQGDRIIIEYLFSKEEFGDYFYLATFFLFPYSLLQSYVGFKELVNIKNDKFNLKMKLKQIIINSVFFTLFILSLGYFLAYYGILKFNFAEDYGLILMFTLIGNIKMVYSLFSAVVAVKSNSEQLKLMNIIFIIAIIACSALFFVLDKTLFLIIALFASLWLLRLIIWGYYSVYQKPCKTSV